MAQNQWLETPHLNIAFCISESTPVTNKRKEPSTSDQPPNWYIIKSMSVLPEMSQQEQARLAQILGGNPQNQSATKPRLKINRRIIITILVVCITGFSAIMLVSPKSSPFIPTSSNSIPTSSPDATSQNAISPTTASKFGSFLGTQQTQIQDFARSPTTISTTANSATILYSGEIATNLLGNITGRIHDGISAATVNKNIQGIPNLAAAASAKYFLQSNDISGNILSQTPIATQKSTDFSFVEPGKWQVYLNLPAGTNAIQLRTNTEVLDTIYVDTSPTQMVVGSVPTQVSKNATVTIQTSVTSLPTRGILSYKLINVDTRRVIETGQTALTGSTQSYMIQLAGLQIPITSRWIVEIAILTPFSAQYFQSNQFVVEVQ